MMNDMNVGRDVKWEIVFSLRDRSARTRYAKRYAQRQLVGNFVKIKLELKLKADIN